MIGTMIASTAMTAYGQIQAGNNAEEMAALEKQRMEHEALQMDIKANEELAEGQSEAQEYRRKKELAISTATARGGRFRLQRHRRQHSRHHPRAGRTRRDAGRHGYVRRAVQSGGV